jgi:hypothetical protein
LAFVSMNQFFVMPGLVPGIHALMEQPRKRLGWPGQARP